MITRDEALALLKKYNKDPFHIQHALTVEAVMKWYAKELGYGEEEEYWGIVGLLHDIDFELYPEEHCLKAPELLREAGVGDDIIHAVCSHGYGITVGCGETIDVEPVHEMEKVLFAADELTGLIWAAALMRPSKSTKDMELSVNMNWSFERNELLSLNGYYNGQYLTAPQSSTISSLWGAGFHGPSGVVEQIVGEQIGVFQLPHCNGFITLDDGTQYYDVTDESYICGQATPKATVGSNIALRYKNFDATMQINGAFGHKIYNGTALTYSNLLSLPNYNMMKGAPEKNIVTQIISDYWLENGDYVNIDYVTLGWNVPLHSKYVQGLRVSLSVNNLATITGYSGLTPMINSRIINGTLGIDDKNVLPVYRSYTMGISIKF